jgi:hypothetical protein
MTEEQRRELKTREAELAALRPPSKRELESETNRPQLVAEDIA